ncbi:aflatoxin B1-aldehyde reductase GliO-like protein [Babesia caballi]|uniref:Aflatoxin B1-aldehyde reductase GliO-like protein n=1 Tax=Babesia caballi TaxID=5871 RepID=A0AAV4M1U0_BABCB|nr:aflatoxin B1-aldehyde reductase GliO-like protein [Babesia caballi]
MAFEAGNVDEGFYGAFALGRSFFAGSDAAVAAGSGRRTRAFAELLEDVGLLTRRGRRRRLGEVGFEAKLLVALLEQRGVLGLLEAPALARILDHALNQHLVALLQRYLALAPRLRVLLATDLVLVDVLDHPAAGSVLHLALAAAAEVEHELRQGDPNRGIHVHVLLVGNQLLVDGVREDLGLAIAGAHELHELVLEGL